MKHYTKRLLCCTYTIVFTLFFSGTSVAQLIQSASNNTDVYPLKVCNTNDCPADSFSVLNTPTAMNADAITVQRNLLTYDGISQFGISANFTELWGITYSGITVNGGSVNNYSGVTLGTYRQFPLLLLPETKSLAIPLPHPASGLTGANDPDIALTTLATSGTTYQHQALVVYADNNGDIWLEKYPLTIDATGEVFSIGTFVSPCSPCYYAYQKVQLNINSPGNEIMQALWRYGG